jgi:hypothetical protein
MFSERIEILGQPDLPEKIVWNNRGMNYGITTT